MAWIFLLISAVLEAVWATALSASDGFSRLGPTVLFVVSFVCSMAGLAQATRTISMGTAYAMWTGIGAALTVVYGMATGGEPVSWLKVLCILGIVGATVGLKLLPQDEAAAPVRNEPVARE